MAKLGFETSIYFDGTLDESLMVFHPVQDLTPQRSMEASKLENQNSFI